MVYMGFFALFAKSGKEMKGMRKRMLAVLLLLALLPVCAFAGAEEAEYRTLQQGDTGRDVLRLKQAMYWLGYFTNLQNLSDSYNKTMAERVAMLQENNGLTPDGVATPELQALVYSGRAAKTDTAPDPSPVPTPAPTPVAPGSALTPPEQDENGFIAAGEPYVYQNEEDGHWAYISHDIQVEIKRYADHVPALKSKKKGALVPLVWFETHIKLKEGTPLRSLLSVSANGNKGRALKQPQDILENYGNVIVAFSDDFFGYRREYDQTLGVIIRDGEIYSDKTKDNGASWLPQLDIFAVFEDGTAKTFLNREHTAQEYLAMGVKDTYAFGPVLVQDGKLSDDIYTYSKLETQPEPRTAIGYLGPNEYLILTVIGRWEGYSDEGATILWLAERMEACGVLEAMNLDGGNTCSLYFMGQLLNRSKNVQKKDIRYVSGLIGVVEE